MLQDGPQSSVSCYRQAVQVSPANQLQRDNHGKVMIVLSRTSGYLSALTNTSKHP